MEGQHTGEQYETQRMEAQSILKKLQNSYVEGQLPSTEDLNELLTKAEEILLRTAAQKCSVDPDSAKILEDLALLTTSMKRMAKYKDVGDKLQTITSETQQALSEVEAPGLSQAAIEASKHALAFVQALRTLLELVMSSKEFRNLLMNFGLVARKVFLKNTEGGAQDKQESSSSSSSSSNERVFTITPESTSSFSISPQQPSSSDYKINISKEEAEQLQNDATKIMSSLGKNNDFREGVRKIFELLDIAREQVKATTNRPEVSKATPHARKAQLETEDLIASFSGRDTLDNFVRDLRHLISKLDNDSETRDYLTLLRNFILEECTKENIEKSEVKNRTNQLMEKGRGLIEKYRYADELNDFLNSADKLMENINNDECVSLLKHHAGIVVSDLSYTDASGKTHLDTDMLNKIRSIIVPIIADTLKYIPIPRIEDSDEYRDYWLDNIVLCGYDAVPEKVRVQIETDSELNVRDIEVKKSYTRLVLTLKEIKTELKDMDFYYKRKSFPEMTENGKFTLRLGGDGASLVIDFNIEQSSGKAPALTDGKATFNIHQMDIIYDKSSLTHALITPMITSMLKKSIQKNIEITVENTLQKLIDNIGSRLTEALAEVNRPLTSRLDFVKQTIKGTEIGQTFEKRREKLE